MKVNKNKYYVSIENRVYSVSIRQYQTFLKMIKGVEQNTDSWDAGLRYIEENSKYEFELTSYFRYV